MSALGEAAASHERRRDHAVPSAGSGEPVAQALDIHAAGGLLWRRAAGGNGAAGGELEVAMVHRPRYDDWSMPKGKLHGGEQPLLGACREVVEETGMTPVVGERLPSQEYWLGPDRKIVDYWAMTPRAGGRFEPNGETDAIRWAPPAEAVAELSYQRDRELLRAFLAAARPTGTLLLVRHARAGDRSSWSHDDAERPLDPVGRQQALMLAAALAWFAPRRVFSADRARCVQTVAPLAAALGLPVEREPTLSEEAYLAHPARGRRRIRALAALGVPVVVCSQGAVIPDLVSRLAAESRLTPGRRAARKASVWALSMVEQRLVAADYYPDLAR